LESIWNVQRSWCLGDGSAYLTTECLNAYAEFLEIDKEETVHIAQVFGNVQAYCGDEITQVLFRFPSSSHFLCQRNRVIAMTYLLLEQTC
jgi:hypothetical protein